MKWDKYIHAFNLIQVGQSSPTITNRQVIEHNQWHQIFQFTFDDGAVLKFENEVPIPDQLFAGPPPKPYFQVIRPPDENKDDFRIGEAYVLTLKQNDEDTPPTFQ